MHITVNADARFGVAPVNHVTKQFVGAEKKRRIRYGYPQSISEHTCVRAANDGGANTHRGMINESADGVEKIISSCCLACVLRAQRGTDLRKRSAISRLRIFRKFRSQNICATPLVPNKHTSYYLCQV